MVLYNFSSEQDLPADQAIITEACLLVGQALSPYTGLSAEDSFQKVFAGLTFVANPKLKTYYGHAADGGKTIEFKPGKISVLLIIHELGHAFNDSMPLLLEPYKILQREWIRTKDGKGILGLPAPKNGFPSDKYGKDRQHPQRWEVRDGLPFSFIEDWCDMFMLWVVGRLPTTEAGQARKAWMDSVMIRLLSTEKGGEPCH